MIAAINVNPLDTWCTDTADNDSGFAVEFEPTETRLGSVDDSNGVGGASGCSRNAKRKGQLDLQDASLDKQLGKVRPTLPGNRTKAHRTFGGL